MEIKDLKNALGRIEVSRRTSWENIWNITVLRDELEQYER